MAERDYSNKTVLISGAAGGLGSALAKRFGRAGAKIVLTDLDRAGLDDLGSELSSMGIESLSLTLDVSSYDQCREAIEEALQKFGALDVLINNAGISHRSLLAETDLEVLRRVVEVNLFGSIHLTKAAYPHLLDSRGQIIVISTVAGFAPLIGRTGYAASKHALHGFFNTLRAESVGTGLTVSVVCPGFIKTGLEKTALSGRGGEVEQTKKTVGKVMTPDEAADEVFKAARSEKRLTVLTSVGKLSYFVSRFAPRFYERMMIKSIGPEFQK